MRDLHQEVTDRILADIDKAGEWKPSWRKAMSLPINHTTNRYYRGINVFMLWIVGQSKGYAHNNWASFKQWKKVGGSVRKGEHGTPIIYYNVVEKIIDGVKQEIPLIRCSTVFNIHQVEGVQLPANPDPLPESERNARCETWMDHMQEMGLDLRFAPGRAFFKPSEDYVSMPEFGDFKDAEHYYATFFHEAVHWTGHHTRLGRFKEKVRPTKDEYAYEELVAELGASFICAELGIEQITREDHTAYLAHWINAMKADKKLIFKAAAAASKASDMIRPYQLNEALVVDEAA